MREDALEIALSTGAQFLFDLEGRPLRSGSVNEYLFRGISHRGYRAKKRAAADGGGFERTPLTQTQLNHFCQKALDSAAAVHCLVKLKKGLQFAPGWETCSGDDLRQVLEKCTAKSVQQLEQQGRDFSKVYRPIPVLPPDQYSAFVLQVTEGCPFNQCTFCSLYRDTTYRVKSTEEFREHVIQASVIHGLDLRRRVSIFLGQANALGLPADELFALFQIINETFELPSVHVNQRPGWARGHANRFSGIHSFIDGFSGILHGVEEFRTLRNLGLRRVYLGLESGCGELLEWLEKPAHPDNMLETLKTVVQSGLSADCILLVGAGGRRFNQQHTRESIQFLKKSGLPPGSRVYLSPIQSQADDRYSMKTSSDHIIPLSDMELRAQSELLIQEIRALGLQPVPYRIDPFVY